MVRICKQSVSYVYVHVYILNNCCILLFETTMLPYIMAAVTDLWRAYNSSLQSSLIFSNPTNGLSGNGDSNNLEQLLDFSNQVSSKKSTPYSTVWVHMKFVVIWFRCASEVNRIECASIAFTWHNR